jgi:hypothetical protein
MKYLLLILLLPLLISCDDRSAVLQLELESIRSRNAELEIENRSLRHREMYRNYTQTVCVTNNLLSGCNSLINHLSYEGVKLTKETWEFCKQYEAK